MLFLPDVYVKCDVCKGKRYNRETLEVKYKGLSIADVLELTVDEAAEFFGAVPRIANKLKTIQEAGLGYIRLGQPATTLSGGEAQRVKLATELGKKFRGNTLYLLDEPTTGLHYTDVKKLLILLHKLVEHGNSVLAIEHNLDVLASADYIMDLGPEGGKGRRKAHREGHARRGRESERPDLEVSRAVLERNQKGTSVTMDKFRKKNEKPREREAAPEGELCWGRNPVISLLEESPERCMKVLVSETMQPHVKTKDNLALPRGGRSIPERGTGRARPPSRTAENHQGVAAYLTQAKLWDADELLEKTSRRARTRHDTALRPRAGTPHNLGAMIRSAEAAGASAVLIPKRGGCLPTGTVIKTSAGAARCAFPSR